MLYVVIGIVVLFLFLRAFCNELVKLLFHILQIIIKDILLFIWWLVKAPFHLIGMLLKRRKEKNKNRWV